MTLRSPISTRVVGAAVRDVLGLAADDGERVDDVLLAERRLAEDAGVGDQASAPADRDVRADDAVGPDFHVIGDALRGGRRRPYRQSGWP